LGAHLHTSSASRRSSAVALALPSGLIGVALVVGGLLGVGPGAPRVGTGVGLVVGALALAARVRAGEATPPGARALAVAASACAAALLAAELSARAPGLAGRSSAVGLLAAAAGIALASSGDRVRARRGAQVAGAGAALAAVNLVGYAYGSDSLAGILGGTASDPLGALGVLLLGLGAATSRRGFWLARVAAGRTLGAAHVRRALPALLGIPFATGLAAGLAARAGLLSVPTAFALLALACMAALVAAAARHGRRLDQLARERLRLESLFRRTFETAAVGFAHVDVEGRWLRVNDRLCEIVGRAREELRGASIHELTHADDRDGARAVYESLARGEIDSHRAERRFLRKQGGVVWVETVLSAERDRAGRVEHLVAVVQDISERKRAEAALDLVRHALDASSDGLVIVSAARPEGEIVFVNRAFERITGYDATEAVGRGWDLIGRRGSGDPPLEALCERMRRENGITLHFRSRRKSGADYVAEIRLAPVADGQSGAVTHYVGVLVDATDRLAAVAERERLLGEAISAREEAERAGRAKDEFLALVSHELRSPLGVVASWLPMLRSDARLDLRERAAAVIERNVALLSRLIGDLLDASRMASGKLDIDRRPFELVGVVSAAVAALHPAARDRELVLEFRADDGELFVVGDAERMDQVVHNLVRNAIKFTPPGGRIDVEVRRAGQEVWLTVADTGQGIAPELLPTVFARFRQRDGGPRGVGGGLGLGLSIVRRLVELHEGRVEVASEGRGCGARVEVRLPLAPAPVVAAERVEAVAHGSLEGLRVLLLEPDRAAAEALALVLEAADAEVSWVRAADDARTPGTAPAPDAIVAAFDAAPEDAAELVRAAKARHKAPLAVALSTDRGAEARARAHEAGFDALLARPFDPARLVHLLRSLRERRRTRVLVVDDDRDAADSLALLLERHGFAATAAYGAEEALREASRRAPDAVVTDVRLGDGRGTDVARTLRARGGRMRVVAVTGSAAHELGDEAGLFDAVVQKPVAPGTLVEALRG